ncbi:MAG: type I methionyl aminopeptidase, partial [Candidatus Sumerlaeaceae bacterium]|nr:type I methionyl aminopeptidase [Candidatus Sumerlaeaceae bacterium]
GDIVTVDVGAYYRGFHGDAAVTLPVGKIAPGAQALLEVTAGALNAALSQAVAGRRLGDISHAIQAYVESRGYFVTRVYTGHGIGRQLHEDPQVLNYGQAGQGVLLRRGMTLAIEPMVLIGTEKTRVLEDGWTVVSANGRLTAHFEHTVAIADGEPDILTLV